MTISELLWRPLLVHLHGAGIGTYGLCGVIHW